MKDFFIINPLYFHLALIFRRIQVSNLAEVSLTL